LVIQAIIISLAAYSKMKNEELKDFEK